jgi:hypothetical protein
MGEQDHDKSRLRSPTRARRQRPQQTPPAANQEGQWLDAKLMVTEDATNAV